VGLVCGARMGINWLGSVHYPNREGTGASVATWNKLKSLCVTFAEMQNDLFFSVATNKEIDPLATDTSYSYHRRYPSVRTGSQHQSPAPDS
jgi:hypothetical protein